MVQQGGGSVIADPEKQERWRELVVHPEDWLLVLRDAVNELSWGKLYGVKVDTSDA